LPDSFIEGYPEIDWHRIRGFRNRIVHDYMGIDFEIVWEIRNQYLKELIASLVRIYVKTKKACLIRQAF
jgi:uncharacterized protein with HEPN domain